MPAKVEAVENMEQRADKSDKAVDEKDLFKGLKSKRLAPAEFWEVVGRIPEDTWGRYSAYVFRHWPRIDRKLSDPRNDNNIEIINSPFDADYLLKKHGEGDYEIYLNDLGRPKNNRAVCTVVLRLRSAEYPPVINFAELCVDDPSNRSYVEGLRARGLLPTGAKPDESSGALGLLREVLMNERTRRQPESVEGQAIGKALDLLSTTFTTGMQTTIGQMKQDDPEKFTKFVAAIKDLQGGRSDLKDALDVVRTVIEQSRKDDSPVVQLLLAESRANRELLLTMIQANKDRPREDVGKQIDTLLGVLEKARGLFGAGETADVAGRWGWIAALGPYLPQTADVLGRYWAWGRTQGTLGAAPPHASRAPAKVGAVTSASTVPAASAAPASNSTIGGPGSPPSGPTGPLDPVQLAVLNMALAALEVGLSGDEFAERLERRWGQAAYDQVAAGGEAGLWGLLGQVPQLQAYPPGQLGKFVAEFIAYGREEEQEAAGEMAQSKGDAK